MALPFLGTVWRRMRAACFAQRARSCSPTAARSPSSSCLLSPCACGTSLYGGDNCRKDFFIKKRKSRTPKKKHRRRSPSTFSFLFTVLFSLSPLYCIDNLNLSTSLYFSPSLSIYLSIYLSILLSIYLYISFFRATPSSSLLSPFHSFFCLTLAASISSAASGGRHCRKGSSSSRG